MAPDYEPASVPEGGRKYYLLSKDSSTSLDDIAQKMPSDTQVDGRYGYQRAHEIEQRVTARARNAPLNEFLSEGIHVLGFEFAVAAPTDQRFPFSELQTVTETVPQHAIGVQLIWAFTDGSIDPDVYLFAVEGTNGLEPIQSADPPELIPTVFFVGHYSGEQTNATHANWKVVFPNINIDASGGENGRGGLLSGEVSLRPHGAGADGNNQRKLWYVYTVELGLQADSEVCVGTSSYVHGLPVLSNFRGQNPPDSWTVPSHPPGALWSPTPSSALKNYYPDVVFGRDEFVTANGAQFMVGNESRSFVGGNHPTLRKEPTEIITAWFDQWKNKIPDLNVLRAAAFGSAAHDCLPLQPKPGKYNETAFKRLDELVYQCGRHGVRLVLALTDNWDYNGGIPQYVKWWNEHDGGNRDPKHFFVKKSNNSEFNRAVDWYTDYVEYVLERTNTITGVQYKNSPTIMVWELANEPRPSGTQNPPYRTQDKQNFKQWVDHVYDYITNTIGTDQLVSTGMEGVPYKPGGTNRIEPSTFYIEVQKKVDVWSLHIWVDGEDDPGHDRKHGKDGGKKLIQTHAQTAEMNNMPMYIGEFGWFVKPASNVTNDQRQRRNEAFEAWRKAMQASKKVDGALAWNLRTCQEKGKIDDNFAVFPDDRDKAVWKHLRTLAKTFAQR